MGRGGHPGGSPWVIDSEPALLLAWPERSQGDTARLLQLFTCLTLGKWGLGKQQCRSTFCCTSTEFCPESRASSFHRTSPGKSLCKPAFPKRNTWRLPPAPWLPFFFSHSPSSLALRPLIPSSSKVHYGGNLEGGNRNQWSEASRRLISMQAMTFQEFYLGDAVVVRDSVRTSAHTGPEASPRRNWTDRGWPDVLEGLVPT